MAVQSFEPNISSGNNNSHILYFHNGIAGNVEELRNRTGGVLSGDTYKIWGSARPQTRHEMENSELVLGNQHLRFQGQFYDFETGLHYNTFRYYDPDIGKFLTSDPIGLEGGLNLYQYSPNPIIWADPLGWVFGSGKGQHHAKATVFDSSGKIKSISRWQSGNMTPSEAALKFPQNTLATHTEARITRGVEATHGDILLIEGQYPPCNSCKGKMNKFANETGARTIYTWPGDNGTTNTWENTSKKPRARANGCK